MWDEVTVQPWSNKKIERENIESHLFNPLREIDVIEIRNSHENLSFQIPKFQIFRKSLRQEDRFVERRIED